MNFASLTTPGDTIENMGWGGLALSGGRFQGMDGNDWIEGAFYGSMHEKVGGTFQRRQYIGAFGA